MNELNRNAFLVIPKHKLISVLKNNGKDDDDPIYHPIVLTSRAADSEILPGTMTVLNNELKSFYIINHVYLFLDGKTKTENLLGVFSTKTQFFDEYWELREALCMECNINYE